MDNDNKTYKNPIAEQEHREVPLPQDMPENLPDFLKDVNWFGACKPSDFLNFAKPYTPPRYTLQRGETKFANVGDLHVVTGKPGQGKTGLMKIFEATILSGKYGKTEYALSKERPNPKVLYIDTEQSEDDTIAFKNSVCTMSGIDYTIQPDNFFILRLRDVKEVKDRWCKILDAIWQVRPTDIFLDGMLDIVKDYNDQVECQPVVRSCMMLATYYDASLWMVLHENPLVSKLVGTLGSITQRKVTEIFEVIKVKQEDLKPNEKDTSLPSIYFIVNQTKARGKDVSRWYYKYDMMDGWSVPTEFDKPETLLDETGNIKVPAKEKEKEPSPLDDPQLVKNAVSVIRTDKNVSFSALRERIRREMKCASNMAGDYIHAGVRFGFLTLSDNKYTANPEDLFADGTNDLPF